MSYEYIEEVTDDSEKSATDFEFPQHVELVDVSLDNGTSSDDNFSFKKRDKHHYRKKEKKDTEKHKKDDSSEDKEKEDSDKQKEEKHNRHKKEKKGKKEKKEKKEKEKKEKEKKEKEKKEKEKQKKEKKDDKTTKYSNDDTYWSVAKHTFGDPDVKHNEFVKWTSKPLRENGFPQFYAVEIKKEGVDHSFPKQHTDNTFVSVEYEIPKDKIWDVLKLSDSLSYDRVCHILTSRCAGHRTNAAILLLALKLANGDITLEDANRREVLKKMVNKAARSTTASDRYSYVKGGVKKKKKKQHMCFSKACQSFLFSGLVLWEKTKQQIAYGSYWVNYYLYDDTDADENSERNRIWGDSAPPLNVAPLKQARPLHQRVVDARLASLSSDNSIPCTEEFKQFLQHNNKLNRPDVFHNMLSAFYNGNMMLLVTYKIGMRHYSVIYDSHIVFPPSVSNADDIVPDWIKSVVVRQPTKETNVTAQFKQFSGPCNDGYKNSTYESTPKKFLLFLKEFFIIPFSEASDISLAITTTTNQTFVVAENMKRKKPDTVDGKAELTKRIQEENDAIRDFFLNSKRSIATTTSKTKKKRVNVEKSLSLTVPSTEPTPFVKQMEKCGAGMVVNQHTGVVKKVTKGKHATKGRGIIVEGFTMTEPLPKSAYPLTYLEQEEEEEADDHYYDDNNREVVEEREIVEDIEIVEQGEIIEQGEIAEQGEIVEQDEIVEQGEIVEVVFENFDFRPPGKPMYTSDVWITKEIRNTKKTVKKVPEFYCRRSDLPNEFMLSENENEQKMCKILTFNSDGDFNWPQKSALKCWNCCECFSAPPAMIPRYYNRPNAFYEVYGNFCDWVCAKTFANDASQPLYSERAPSIDFFAHKYFGVKLPLRTRPPRFLLNTFSEFGMSLDEYRLIGHFESDVVNYRIMQPPCVPGEMLVVWDKKKVKKVSHRKGYNKDKKDLFEKRMKGDAVIPKMPKAAESTQTTSQMLSNRKKKNLLSLLE